MPRLKSLVFLAMFCPLLGLAILPPTLISPCGGFSYDPALPLILNWDPAAGALSYNVQVSWGDPNFALPFQDVYTSATFVQASGISYDSPYYWRVRASDGNVWSSWSSSCQFFTIPIPAPPQPILQIPTNGAVGLVSPVGMQWSWIPAPNIELQVATSVAFTSPTVINTSGQNHSLTGLAAGQTYFWRVRGSNVTGTGQWSETWSFTTAFAATTLNLRVILQGPWNSTSQLMNDQLRTGGLIPNAEPYSDMGFTGITNANASIGSGVLAVTGNNAVVDWVLVEARHATASTVLARWCMLLQRDGDLMMPNGAAPSLQFPSGQVRIAVRHRTHLSCMGSTVFNATGTPITLDLTATSTPVFGTLPTATVSGYRALWAGDTNGDGQVIYTGAGNDRDQVLQIIGGIVPTNSVTGYRSSDINLDGTTLYTGSGNDRDAILLTIGGTVPTAVRVAQLP